jgi:hypothetical protein
MDYTIAIAAFYVVGAIGYAGYNSLEISTLHRQHESTRDKNVKNLMTSLAKEHLVEVKMSWAWPVRLVSAVVKSLVWSKSL